MDRFSPLSALLLASMAAGLTAFAPRQAVQPPAPIIVGLDHIPIAVNDLDVAARRYRALGFVLKPGMAHANGIQNQHAKFPDGTELELITAPEARDPLTTTYRGHLSQGDGPAFAAFYAPVPGVGPQRLEQAGLRYIFLGPRNASPTDTPEHFQHPNSAESLISIWLAGSDLSKEQQVLRELGATIDAEVVRAPDALEAPVAHVGEGTVLFLPGSHQSVKNRRVVGATLRVKSLAATRLVLENSGLSLSTSLTPARGSSIFLPPSVTHGLWLEFRQTKVSM